MIAAIVKLAKVEGLSTHILLESRRGHMCFEAICSEPDSFTLGSTKVHEGISETRPIPTCEESWTSMNFPFIEQRDSCEGIDVLFVRALGIR